MGAMAPYTGFLHESGHLNMNGQNRADIWPGLKVRVVEKQNQRNGQVTEGIVQKVLTSSPSHPHGIKVMLVNGAVGRVKEILST